MKPNKSMVHSLLMTAFLLVIGHGLIPHWHHRLLPTPAITASPQTVSFSLFGAFVSLDLGEDHLENYASPESSGSDIAAPVALFPATNFCFSLFPALQALPTFRQSPDEPLAQQAHWLSSLSFRAPPRLV